MAMDHLQGRLGTPLGRRRQADDSGRDGDGGNRDDGFGDECPGVDGSVQVAFIVADGHSIDTGGAFRMSVAGEVRVDGTSGMVFRFVVVGMRMDEKGQHGGSRHHHDEPSRDD